MLTPVDLDPKAVRLQSARRARGAEGTDFLLREVEGRMLDRLSVVRLQPGSVLDAGCGTGSGLVELRKRYPQALLVGIDPARAMAAAARARLAPAPRGFLARLRGGPREPAARLAAAELQALPFAASGFDLIWSNLALHWVPEPQRAFAELYRVIRPNGLLTFSMLGVDTLAELRGLGARFMRFHDMHDLGDALAAEGFAEPVMDAERMTVTWRDPLTLLREVHAWGGNADPARFRGLLGRGHLREWLAAIEGLRGADGLIRLTVEVVFGHAWCPPEKRLPRGLAPLRFVPRRGRAEGPAPGG